MKINIKPQAIICVDPDVEASGFGFILITNGAVFVEYTTLPLPKLIYELTQMHREYSKPNHPVRIFIEAGWLNKGNWHLNPRDNKQTAAAKGRQAGRNHQLGLDICAMLDYLNVPHTEVAPLIKSWKGKDRKITHEELDKIVKWVNGTGLPKKRSNQEERDALLLAWEKSGLPFKC